MSVSEADLWLFSKFGGFFGPRKKVGDGWMDEGG